MKHGKWPKFQKLHIWSLFLPQGVEIELIFALQAAVSKIRANFLTCHIWAWNLASGQKFQKLHMYPLSIPQEWNLAYFRSTGSGFHDMGQFLSLLDSVSRGHGMVHATIFSEPNTWITFKFWFLLPLGHTLGCFFNFPPNFFFFFFFWFFMNIFCFP